MSSALHIVCILFFFFKQKTSYEMRISDWSADVCSSDLQSCDPAFTAFVAERLRALGYSVAVNDPYKGAEIIRMHGRPAEGRHSLQIEMKRALYMNEASVTANDGYDKLKADLRLLENERAS